MRALLWVNVFLPRVKYRRLGAEVFAGWADDGFTGGSPTSPMSGDTPSQDQRKRTTAANVRAAHAAIRLGSPGLSVARSALLQPSRCRCWASSGKAPDSAPTYMGML